MKFLLIEPDKLMWPGKLGLISNSQECLMSESGLKNIAEKSEQLFFIPSGNSNTSATFIFSSNKDLGRVEVVLQHGYLWPVNPPFGGRQIMEELTDHLNSVSHYS